MKVPCSSGILFNTPCKRNGEIDTECEAYSLTKRGNQKYYYHYECYLQNPVTLIPLSKNAKDSLREYLSKIDDKEVWVEEVLNSLKS